jgi:hypothetical protein
MTTIAVADELLGIGLSSRKRQHAGDGGPAGHVQSEAVAWARVVTPDRSPPSGGGRFVLAADSPDRRWFGHDAARKAEPHPRDGRRRRELSLAAFRADLQFVVAEQPLDIVVEHIATHRFTSPSSSRETAGPRR